MGSISMHFYANPNAKKITALKLQALRLEIEFRAAI